MKVINNFKVLGIVSILILSLGFIAGCSSKNKVNNTIQQSEETKGYENIDGKQTEKLLNSDKDVLIIDVRSEYEYEKGHLLNAINLPYDDDDFKSELNEIIDYKDKTVLVISHRMKSIENVDKIIVMENGKIESQGTHSELLEKSKVYNTMVRNSNLTENYSY